MPLLAIMPFLTMLSCSLAGAAEAARIIRIESFTTVKALHSPGEPVDFRAAVARAESDADPLPITLRLTVRRGVAPAVTVQQDDLTLTEASIDWRASWRPGEAQYGFLAELEALSEDGQVLGSARTIFEVSANWPLVMRLATIEPYKFATPTTSDQQIAQWVARARASGINAIETFAWMPASYYMDTDQESWPEYSGPKPGRLTSASKLKLWSDLLHRNGMKFVAYNEHSAIKQPDDWKVYNPHNAVFDPTDFLAPYYRDQGLFLPNALKAGDLLGRQLAASIKRFGWDGLLMDSGSQAMFATAEGLDRQGKPLTDLSPGQVGRRHMADVRAHVDKVSPDFKFISQNAWASFVGRSWHFRRPLPAILPSVRNYYARGEWSAYNDLIDMWSTESDPQSMRTDRYAATYDRLAVTLNTTIEVTHKPLLIWAQISQHDNDGAGRNLGYVKPFLATVLASRTTFNDHFEMYGGTMTGEPEDPVNQAIAHYRRFAARYSEYLFDPQLRWDEEPWRWLSCYASPSNMMWEHTVYSRDLPDGRRRTIVHLLNLPLDRRIVADHALPDTLTQFSLHLRFTGPQRPIKAYCLRADSPAQDPIELRTHPTEPDHVFDSEPDDWGLAIHFSAGNDTGLDTWNVVVIEEG